jgi:hypothetical protein
MAMRSWRFLPALALASAAAADEPADMLLPGEKVVSTLSSAGETKTLGVAGFDCRRSR